MTFTSQSECIRQLASNLSQLGAGLQAGRIKCDTFGPVQADLAALNASRHSRSSSAQSCWPADMSSSQSRQGQGGGSTHDTATRSSSAHRRSTSRSGAQAAEGGQPKNAGSCAAAPPDKVSIPHYRTDTSGSGPLGDSRPQQVEQPHDQPPSRSGSNRHSRHASWERADARQGHRAAGQSADAQHPQPPEAIAGPPQPAGSDKQGSCASCGNPAASPPTARVGLWRPICS